MLLIFLLDCGERGSTNCSSQQVMIAQRSALDRRLHTARRQLSPQTEGRPIASLQGSVSSRRACQPACGAAESTGTSAPHRGQMVTGSRRLGGALGSSTDTHKKSPRSPTALPGSRSATAWTADQLVRADLAGPAVTTTRREKPGAQSNKQEHHTTNTTEFP